MVTVKSGVFLSGVSACALLWADLAPARGQTADGAAGAAIAAEAGQRADAAAELETVVVTARRRAEGLLEVPVSVSVLTAGDLDRNAATDLAKIGELTPGVIVANYKGNSGGSIAVRGISSSANQFGFEQAVSVALDGVQFSSGRIATVGFFDLEQVEVLKGPQALFFGKNSPAGVISLTSAGPTPEFEASLRAGYEFEGDELLVEGAVSGPLGDRLSGRLAVRYRKLEGWMFNDAQPVANPFFTPNQPAGAADLPGAYDNRVGDEELLGRLTLVFEPTDTFDATLKVLVAALDDQGNGLASQNIGPCVGEQPRVFGVPDPFGECRPDNRLTNGARPPVIAQASPRAPDDGRYRGEADLIAVSLNADWDIGQFTLAAISGYSQVSNDSYSGIDQTTFTQVWVVDDNETAAFSQELRLQSNFGGPFNFMVGGYYQNVDETVYNEVGALDFLGFNPANGRYASYEKLDTLDGATYSAFAQFTYDLTDQLELSAGARYTEERKDARITNLYGTNTPLGQFDTANTIFPDSRDPSPGVLAARFKDTNVSPEVTLTWRPQRDRSVYVAYKTGFKSGGFGLSTFLQTNSTIADFDFDSEEAEGFEIGAKGLFFDGRLRLTSTAFLYDFENLQVSSYDAVALRYQVDNAGALEQKGIDLDARLRVNSWLDLRFAVAYVRNRFDDFTGQCYTFNIPASDALTADAPPNCSFILNPDGSRFVTGAGTPVLQQVFDGRAPARSPDWSGNVGLTVNLPVMDRFDLQLTGDAFYSDGYFAAETMAPSTFQDSFWRYNAGLRLSDADGRWDIFLIGRNLSNEFYLTYAADRTGGSSIPLVIGEQRGVVARGREVVVQAGVRF